MAAKIKDMVDVARVRLRTTDGSSEGSRQQRSDKAVALVVKRTVLAAQTAASAAGNRALFGSLDPRRYAGHSLWAGFITSAAAAGVSAHDIMRHSQPEREDTLRKYIHNSTIFRHNAAATVWL